LEGETPFNDLIRGDVTFANETIDDFVILKSDGYPTYHLASVVDDHLMGISHVIRAEEWISSTPKHVLLYGAFGWPAPTFIHLPLLRNKDRSKISKRKDPTSLDWYREQGYLPEALLNFLALMGWSLGDDREVFSVAEMIEGFSWDRVKSSGPVFDIQKLDWLNGEYIRAMGLEELLERILAGPYTSHTAEPADRLLAILALVQERIKKLAEFDAMTAFFFAPEPYEAALLVPKKQDAEFVRAALAGIEEALQSAQEWKTGPLEGTVRALCEERGWKRGAAYMVLRVAVTCRTVSTPLFETMELLGREECFRRTGAAAQAAREL
ncbi:MAG: glutamate--tRNA ligase, partial [Candidatus Brocadiia bacterium]|nr:glutamate--tRNA ligase [Candidatus Brocadiia bacterium]